jgi:diphthamide biosynthesis methyltransferase
MFYLVGLGLGDAKDITVKGLEIVKKSKRVYLEAYTSILTVGKEKLVKYNTIQYNKLYLKSENIKHYNTSSNELLNPT